MPDQVSLTPAKPNTAIVFLVIDNPPVNAISPGIPAQAIQLIKKAETDPDIDALIVAAGGNGGFGGADIEFFDKPWPEGEADLRDLIDCLDNCAIPTAMMMRHYALGGGLEIALACRYRMAIKGTNIGQPEVHIGVPPGAGATQRLPRLVSVQDALELVISGRPVKAEQALDMGLVDCVLATTDPFGEAADFVSEQLLSSVTVRTRDRSIEAPSPDVFDSARTRAKHLMRGEVAPLKAIDCVEAATRLPFDEGLIFEKKCFEECLASYQSNALRHLFFAERNLDQIPGRSTHTSPKPIQTVAVIGAGTMGRGIAVCLSNAGVQVSIIERDESALTTALEEIERIYRHDVAKKGLSETSARERVDRISGTLTYEDLDQIDLVIEAVFEDIAVKKQVFETLARQTGPDTILATNTSFLDINEIAAAAGSLKHNVIGLHFFSPAHIMPLLEVIPGRETNDEVVATAMSFAKLLKKTAVVSGICHGFIANRMFSVYLREAELMLEEGASPDYVDDTLVKFGMPLGPFAVLDLVGLDIAWAERKSNANNRRLGDRNPSVLDKICERGWFGQKTGKGFFVYGEDNRQGLHNPAVDEIIEQCSRHAGLQHRNIPPDEIIERCLYGVVNEGAKILEEGIALRSGDIDVVWVKGFGFPRWRGGPMHYADQTGLKEVARRIEEFSKFDSNWNLSPLLACMAKSGSTFT